MIQNNNEDDARRSKKYILRKMGHTERKMRFKRRSGQDQQAHETVIDAPKSIEARWCAICGREETKVEPLETTQKKASKTMNTKQ